MDNNAVTNIWAKKLLGDSTILICDLFLLFLATFSGDYTLYGIPLFFVFWFIILFIRRKGVLVQREAFTQIVLLFMLIPIIIQFYKYSIEYYFGAVYVILYVNVLIFAIQTIPRLLTKTPSTKIVQRLLTASLLILGIISSFSDSEGSRQSLIFGPNVYYRIIGMIGLIHIIFFKVNYNYKKKSIVTFLFNLFGTLLSLIIAISILVKTGSRGASMVCLWVVLWFLFSVLTTKKILLKIISVAVLSGLAIFIINSNYITLFSSRAFMYQDKGASSASISRRTEFLTNFFDFFQNNNYFLGEGSNYIYSYPHNLYLDLLYNGGIIPFLLIIFFSFRYTILIFKGNLQENWKILSLIFSPIYIGSLVSGTIYDNYPVISLLVLLPISWQNNIISGSQLERKSKIF